MCQICSDTETTLVVHHRCYLHNIDPWDYPSEYLVTLCEDCHETEREAMKEFEPLLLQQIKSKFFADDIRRLALGFSNLELWTASEVVASVYCWALSSVEAQRTLMDMFRADTVERIKDAKA